MMRCIRHPACLAVVLAVGLAVLAGCAEEEPDPYAVPSEQDDARRAAADGAASTPAPAPAPEEAVAPVTVSADRVAMGSALGADGTVSIPATTFKLDDTVHVSFPASGASARVYWTHDDGMTDKQESITLTPGTPAHFSFSRADGMRQGNYMVQVDVDDTPIGIVDFTVE